MFNAIKNLFGNEHDELIDRRDRERAEFEQHDAGFAANIAELETKPLRSLKEIDAAREELKRVKAERDRDATNYRIADRQLEGKIRSTAPESINAAQRRLREERDRRCKALIVKTHVERDAAGSLVGFAHTNKEKIDAQLASIDQAMKNLEALKFQRGVDLAAIRSVEATIPPFDDDVERVECNPVVVVQIGA